MSSLLDPLLKPYTSTFVLMKSQSLYWWRLPGATRPYILQLYSLSRYLVNVYSVRYMCNVRYICTIYWPSYQLFVSPYWHYFSLENTYAPVMCNTFPCIHSSESVLWEWKQLLCGVKTLRIVSLLVSLDSVDCWYLRWRWWLENLPFSANWRSVLWS